jgi:hypothetical protein
MNPSQFGARAREASPNAQAFIAAFLSLVILAGRYYKDRDTTSKGMTPVQVRAAWVESAQRAGVEILPLLRVCDGLWDRCHVFDQAQVRALFDDVREGQCASSYEGPSYEAPPPVIDWSDIGSDFPSHQPISWLDE